VKNKMMLAMAAAAAVLAVAGCSLLGISPETIEATEMITDAFPTVTGGLEVRNLYGDYYTGLQESDFPERVTEYIYSGSSSSGIPLGSVSIPLEVKASMTEGSSSVDVVFVFDTTGSMSGEISGMVDSANDFADALDYSGVDYRIGCVTFGDAYGNTSDGTGLREYLKPTSNASVFKEFMNSLSATGGGDGNENFIDAIDYARTSKWSGDNPEGSFQSQAGFTYRLGAKKVFVGVTDVTYQTPDFPGYVNYYYDAGGPYNSSVYNTLADEIEHLQDDGVTMHVICPEYYKDSYTDLAYETGGVWVNMDSDFSTVIDTVGTSISSNYIIRFTTTDETLDTFRSISFDVKGINVQIEYTITSAGRSSEVISITPAANYQ